MQNLPTNSRTLTIPASSPAVLHIVPEPERESSVQFTYASATPDNTPERSWTYSPQEMALIFQRPPRTTQNHNRFVSAFSAVAASLVIALMLWPNNKIRRSADAAPATQPLSAAISQPATTQPAP